MINGYCCFFTRALFYLQLESEISELNAQKDTEVATRETKLARLKKQMADSLTDNSWLVEVFSYCVNYFEQILHCNISSDVIKTRTKNKTQLRL